ncbi:DUF1702 family protein [Sphaerisporangium sp. TRM90804]|uniref:DUF1702 family protein n=1 Tax=Sphaerisporangium sp. TRM90804 TaxID=3031113 RepID=UPI00244A776D|nr:DUF1702 family protein [Sphaerisporangium sp. TRM90804]MDH2429179.1 DUF1702 family protein [Sphaerisporangium sp. TRM90804]
MTARSLRRLLSLDPQELIRSRPGPPVGDPEVGRTLDTVVHSFATGYNAALGAPPGALDLSHLPGPLRGFAYEGAAMSIGLVDELTLARGRRMRALLDGPGRPYVHLIHVGAGWAFARLRVRPWTGMPVGQRLFRWLAWDGWGFHQAFFRPRAVLVEHRVERAARGDVRPIRDQGVGRALWFYAGADPALVAEVIDAFPAGRRPDLWAGIGLAAAYTGAQPPERLEDLLARAGGHREHLAQGAAFAAKAHQISGIVPERSADAVAALTGAGVDDASDWTDASLKEALRRPDDPATYEAWRAGIRRAWARQGGVVS